MKKFAQGAGALGLAALFALAALPASAQQERPAPEQEQTLGQHVIPGALREKRHRELLADLEEREKEQLLRKTEIADAIRKAHPGISEDQLTLRTEKQFAAEWRALTEKRWKEKTNPALGSPNEDLPYIFQSSVRGCTTDGLVYKMPYNFAFDMKELAAPLIPGVPPEEQSLFARLVQADFNSYQGAQGAGEFMTALDSLTEGVNASVQHISGHLIDEVDSSLVEKIIFGDIVGYAFETISDDVREKYGVTVTITAEKPFHMAELDCAAVEEVAEIEEPAGQPAPPEPEKPPKGLRIVPR